MSPQFLTWVRLLRGTLGGGTSIGALGIWLDEHIDECGLSLGTFSKELALHVLPPGSATRVRDVLPVALPAQPPRCSSLHGKARLRAVCQWERTAWVRLCLRSLAHTCALANARSGPQPGYHIYHGPPPMGGARCHRLMVSTSTHMRVG